MAEDSLHRSMSAAAFKARRKAARISQRQIGQAAKVTEQTVRNFENEKFRVMDWTRHMLVDALLRLEQQQAENEATPAAGETP